MQNRSSIIVSVGIATLLVAAAIFSGEDAARGADECLTQPRTNASASGHWRYRIDHANNNRKCWYLKDEKRDSAKGSGTARDSDAIPVDDDPESIPPSTADARAEMPVTARADAPRTPAAPPQQQQAQAQPQPQKRVANALSPSDIAAAPPAAANTPVETLKVLKVADADPPAANAPADAPAAAAPVDAALSSPELAPSAASPRAAASTRDSPLRVFAGLALIALGVMVLVLCLVFHLLYGDVRLEHGRDGIGRRGMA